MAKLYFYYSAMNAGKTTLLLQSDYNYRERGMNTLLFKPVIDTRFGDDVIKSRIGVQEHGITFDEKFNFLEYVSNCLKIKKIACVFVDEAQFLKREQVFQLSDIVDTFSIPVLTYGLRTDFQANLFEGSKTLLGIADILCELKTICYCGCKAIMNMRIDEKGNPVREGEQILIGGNDRYIAVCRKHFKNYSSDSD